MLKLTSIRKSYKTGDFIQHALHDVSLSFSKNEFVAVLGESGSGKTTLLNIIGGLNRYDDGDLIINNKSTKNGIYDVIVLDWMLPKQDGIDILKSIRENKINSYIIFLTAKDTVEDRVMGLDGGADDYLIKPFSKNELLARIRALSRRVTTEIVEHQLIKIGNIVLDVKRCEYSYSMGYAERLTLQETQLLEYLITKVKSS